MTEDEKKARDDAAAKADADKARADAEETRWNRLDAFMDSIGRRMDAFEEEKKADRAKADAAKKDSEEEKKANEAADEPGAGDPKEVERKAADRKDSDDDKKPEFLKKDSKKDSDDDEDDKKKANASKADAAKADRDALVAENAALKRRMDEFDRKLAGRSVTDDEFSQLSSAQARADAVFSASGARAPRFLDNETPLSYRRRLAGALKQHSKLFKDTDLALFPTPESFAMAETQIYADALTTFTSPASVPAGTLREIRRHDSGREIIEFAGEPKAWMADFAPPRQVLRSFRRPQ